MKNFVLFFILFYFFNVFLIRGQTAVNLNWKTSLGEPDAIGWCSSTVDTYGNTYLTGNTQVANQGTNIYVSKCDRYGSLIWEYDYNNNYNGNDYGIDIAIDNNLNVYVIGTSQTSIQNDYDFTILRIDSIGNNSWVNHYNGTGSGEDIGLAISLDEYNSIVVTGVAVGDSTDKDYVTIKYGNNGNLIWEASYDYHNLQDIPVDIEINDANEIFITGASSDNITKWDIATIKYSISGVQLSERREPGSTIGYDRPIGIKKDQNGNFFITGIAVNSGGNYDIRTVKLDSDLDLLWSVDYDGYNMDDEPSDITIDNDGNVIVTGFIEKNSSKEWITLKYSSLGVLVWERKFKGKDNNDSFGKSVTTDPYGNILVTGSSFAVDDLNVSTFLLSADNKVIWTRMYSPDIAGDEYPLKIQASISGSYNIIGRTDGNNREYFILQYNYINYNRIPYVDGNGVKKYLKDQFIISIHPDSLDINQIANKNKEYGTLTDYLNQSNANIIINKLPPTVSSDNIILKKINKNINPHLTKTVDIHGDSIAMRSDWNQFLVMMDCNGQDSIVRDSLRRLFPLITSVCSNRILKPLYNTPFDYDGTNDPSYDDQYHLHGSSIHINYDLNWEYHNSGSNKTCVVTLNAVKLNGYTINGIALIGAFYEDNGILKCGGYKEIDLSSVNSIAAWGNEGSTPEKDGFSIGEEIIWLMKYPVSDENKVYYLTPTLAPGYGYTNQYSPNGMAAYLSFATWDSYHINIEPAWKVARGTNNLVLGIADSGINLGHIDIPNNCGYISGYDYATNEHYYFNFDENYDVSSISHGTYMAGLIGANRNNDEGTAGICGYNSSTNEGVLIFSAGITSQDMPTFDLTFNLFDDLIDPQSVDNPLSGYISELIVLNFSNGFYLNPNSADDMENRGLFYNKNNKLFKRGISLVTGRGNFITGCSSYTDDCFPATGIYDKKIIVASASDLYGDWVCTTLYDKPSTWNNGITWWERIDIAAPGSFNNVFSVSGTAPSGYGFGDGTSSSAAITSGVIGLLQSSMQTHALKYLNPSEIENQLEENARDINVTDNDEYTGHGLIDAGKILFKNYYPLYSFTDYSYEPDYDSYETLNVIIPFTIVGYDNTDELEYIPAGEYEVIAYKYSSINSHSMGNYSIDTSEEKPGTVNNSKCELYGYPYPDGLDLYIEPTSDVKFVTTPTSSEAELVGYNYKITNTISTFNGINYVTQDVWFPLKQNDNPVFYYSMHGIDISLIGISDLHISKDLELNIYPNPSTDQINISIEKPNSIVGRLLIFDSNGKLIDSKNINGIDNVNVVHNINNYKVGNYFASVLLKDGSFISSPFVKIK